MTNRETPLDNVRVSRETLQELAAQLGGLVAQRTENGAKNKPAHEVRLGSIKATIWANQTEQGNRYFVNVSRIYKDGEQWKKTDSFGVDDLLPLAQVVASAGLWITEHQE